MAGNDSIRPGQLCSTPVEAKQRSPHAIVPDPEVSEAQAIADAGPHGLGGRLLGCETLGQKGRTITASGVFRILVVVENASCEAVPMAFERRGEPRDTDQVTADAVDRHVVS